VFLPEASAVLMAITDTRVMRMGDITVPVS